MEENKLCGSIDRRQFLKILSGGIIIFIFSEELAISQEIRRRGAGQELPTNFNAFLKIGENGRVTCFTGKVELGQGIITSLAQMLAEELDVPMSSVDMVMGDTDLCPWDMGTFGSRTTKYLGPPLREAAAEARSVLIQLAAEHFKIPESQLQIKDGIVIDRKNSANRISYASLVKGKRIERRLAVKPSLKPFSAFTISGKPIARTDSLEKVNGEAKFTGDIKLPGMLYAKILRPPVHGAKLKSVDISAVKDIKDIEIVRDGDFIAVLHPLPDEAEKALGKIKAQFDIPAAKVNNQSIFKHLMNVAPQGNIVAQNGDLEKGKKLASVEFDKTYFNHYVAHAPIETHTATAKIERNKATVWASTQRPFGARDEVAQVLGLSSKDVRVITPFVGGGFGGKTQNMQVVEAARLAKLTRKPVQVAWSRKEEFFYDTFRPASIVKIKSGLDKSNRLTYWDYHVYFAGDRGAESFYNTPNHSTISHGSWSGSFSAHPFGTGAWRAPASNTNTFARESHIDIMAAKTGVDPLEFRLKNLNDERMQRVLKAVASAFRWSPSKAPSGRGYGVACGIYLGTYIAAVAEVVVNKKSGEVKVKRVVCAQDMGQIINPDGAKNQIEGCVMMGLGYALTEEIRFNGGEIHDLNFDTYEIPRFSWLPKIEAVLVENREVPPQGCGEPPITCVGAVIANAIFDATGARLFELPMTPERIKQALTALQKK